MTLNLAFYLLLLMSQVIFYISFTQEILLVSVIQNLASNFVRLLLKIVLLALLKSFGQSITVKAIALGSGELMIIGLDENGVEQFSFAIRQQGVDRYETISNDFDVHELSVSVLDQDGHRTNKTLKAQNFS